LLCDIAIDVEGHAHVLTDGITAREASASDSWQSKHMREVDFPVEMILKALDQLDLEHADASNDSDKKCLLDLLARQFHCGDESWMERITIQLRALFAVHCWPTVVAKCLESPLRSLMASALRLDETRPSLSLSFQGLSEFDNACLEELANAIPSGLVDFHLDCAGCVHIDDVGISRFMVGLPAGLRALSLNFSANSNISDKGMTALAVGLPWTLFSLRLFCSHCKRITDHGVLDLADTLPRELSELQLAFESCIKLGDQAVEAIVRKLPESLDDMELNFYGTSATVAALNRIRTLASAQEFKVELLDSIVNVENHPEPKIADEVRQALHAKSKPRPKAAALAQRKKRCHSTPAVDAEIGEFFSWAAQRWKMIYDLFKCDEPGEKSVELRSVSAQEFVEYVWWHGFEGNALRIFQEAQKEVPTPASIMSSQRESCLGEVSLPQLRGFERRFRSLTKGELPASMRFLQKLRKDRGSLLRAWRLDIDQRGTGLVALADFVGACRRLEFASEAKELWNSFHVDDGSSDIGEVPLEFHDFDMREASNLDKFVDVLWVGGHFDLSRAWSCIDPSSRGMVALEEFTHGVQLLGFNGNARLLFNGLDSTGLGKLRRQELEYLKVFFFKCCPDTASSPPDSCIETMD
jgi:hypothetical protein